MESGKESCLHLILFSMGQLSPSLDGCGKIRTHRSKIRIFLYLTIRCKNGKSITTYIYRSLINLLRENRHI